MSDETKNDIHVELPSGAIARVTAEGAKDQKLLDALDQMMSAAAKQFTPTHKSVGENSPHPIPLNSEQISLCDNWAEDGRLWGNVEARLFNLPTFARAVLAAQLREVQAQLRGDA